MSLTTLSTRCKRYRAILIVLPVTLACMNRAQAIAASKRATLSPGVGDYPLPASTLAQWRTALLSGNDAEKVNAFCMIRQHAWKLFEVVNRPIKLRGNRPSWMAWYSLVDRPTGKNGQLLKVLQSDSFWLTLSRENLDTSGLEEPALIHVYLNDFTAEHIRKHHLNELTVLHRQYASGVENIAQFPRNAITIKTAWKIIHAGDCRSIEYWEPSAPNPPFDFLGQPRSTLVIDSETLKNCPTTGVSPQYRVKDFFSIRISAQNLKSAMRMAGETVTLQPGDVIILVGLHMMTKELPSGFWSTFWWSPDGVDLDDRSDMPEKLKRHSYWKHYVMRATIIMENMRDPHGMANKHRSYSVFNPYIESMSLQGTQSNCIACHAAAGYGPRSDSGQEYRPRCSTRFEQLLRTDYVWTVPLHTDSTLTKDHPFRTVISDIGDKSGENPPGAKLDPYSEDSNCPGNKMQYFKPKPDPSTSP